MVPDETSLAAPEPQRPDAPTVPGRRLLLRGGLAGGTGLVTLVARPVSATTCTQASSFGSVNMSRPNLMASCSGRKPSFWSSSTSYSTWPSQHSPIDTTSPHTKATRFGDVFANSGDFKRKTLVEVMALSDETGTGGVAKYCAAAYLNAIKGMTPVNILNSQSVKDIWTSYASKGHYEPTAGIKWYANESEPKATGGLIAWLKTTMPG